MIIRRTIVIEGWCSGCHRGLMTPLLERSFAEKKQLEEYVGQSLTCARCGTVNLIEEMVDVIPANFYTLGKKSSVTKSNDEMHKYATS